MSEKTRLDVALDRLDGAVARLEATASGRAPKTEALNEARAEYSAIEGLTQTARLRLDAAIGRLESMLVR
ncbi:MAG: hypothetical protein EXQ87_12370 [Alphaproteobacteria bacterium]|nr:hypothetical protein [Alphaproteobacteria bacterium]